MFVQLKFHQNALDPTGSAYNAPQIW